MYIYIKTYMWMFIATLFIIAPNLKQSRCPWVNWRMGKQAVVHPYNGILLSNNKEWSANTTTWVNLKNIMLSERSPIRKAIRHIVWFHVYEILEKAEVLWQKVGQGLASAKGLHRDISGAIGSSSLWLRWWLNDDCTFKMGEILLCMKIIFQ